MVKRKRNFIETLSFLFVGAVLGLIVLSVSPDKIAEPLYGAEVKSILSNEASPNGPQTVIVTYIVPSVSTGDSIITLYVYLFKDGRVVDYDVDITSSMSLPPGAVNYIPSGTTVIDTLTAPAPPAGRTSSYVLQIYTNLKSGKITRARTFYWERKNTTATVIFPDSISVGANIRWNNPVTAGVLGDSFRVWRKEYRLPDTVGLTLRYDGTIFPGDTVFRATRKVALGRMYKYYGSVYLFGSERVRYPFLIIVAR